MMTTSDAEHRLVPKRAGSRVVSDFDVSALQHQLMRCLEFTVTQVLLC